MDEAHLRRQLGRAIRAHRDARGLTQEQLAEAVGMSTEWMSQLERGIGTPSIESLVRLAGALGTDAPGLLAAGLATGRRPIVDELIAEVVGMDEGAIEVVLIAARAVRERWPKRS